MPDAYLHFWKADSLPHPLAFENMALGLTVDREASGQVYTIVQSNDTPTRSMLWSTFKISQCIKTREGQFLIKGDGWQMCPPASLDEPGVDALKSNSFVQLRDDATAKRLVWQAIKHRPPGEPYVIAQFLKAYMATTLCKQIALQMAKQLKKLGPVKPPEVERKPRPPAIAVSNYVYASPITPETEIRCLSIRQPWVHLILQGIKDVENRDWGRLASMPTYRGWLAIHASQTIEPFDRQDYTECKFPTKLPTGCIVGLAHLDDIVHIGDYRKMCRKAKRKTSDWASGEHCLLLSNPICLATPIPFLGRLGIFNLPEELQVGLRADASFRV